MSQKRMFDVKCTDCGKSTIVPFEPRKGKPVFCKICFSKHRKDQADRFNPNTRFNMKNAWARRGDNWNGRKEEHHNVFQKT